MSVNLELQSVWISYPFECHNFMFEARLALSNSFIERYCTFADLFIIDLIKNLCFGPTARDHGGLVPVWIPQDQRSDGGETNPWSLTASSYCDLFTKSVMWYLVAGGQCMMTGCEINKNHFCLSESFCFCGLVVCLRYWSSAW